MPLDASADSDWAPLKKHWILRADTTYLNHGSFGPPPAAVRERRDYWQHKLDTQPMDFFVREFEPAWLAARDRLAGFVGAAPGNLILAENATVAMNIVADSFSLAAGDEVLLTDHEYGAVQRIWQRACEKHDAAAKTVQLPLPVVSTDQMLEAIFSAASDQTRLLVVSHITSPTAIILPVADICREARRRGIAVAIDGPHAIAQEPLAIERLGCDFYTASCHKWLSGPIGSGFLYVAPPYQARVRPPVLSWGRIPPTKITSWSDEFVWVGTRNPAAYLAVPAAIDFLELVGVEAFRERSHWLAQYARRRLLELAGGGPLVPDERTWYGSMAHVPLPPPVGGKVGGESCPISNPLQNTIWQRLGIEVPVVEFRGVRYLRVSCHLYNDTEQIDRLAGGLRLLLKEGH